MGGWVCWGVCSCGCGCVVGCMAMMSLLMDGEDVVEGERQEEG